MTATSAISGVATTFGLPNFVGELFSVSPQDTKFLSAIGGLTGGRQTTAKDFQWQGYDLPDAAQNVALEGAAAPSGTARKRFSFDNVAEVHQSAVEVSYTKQAAVGQLSGLNIAGQNPVSDELGWQVAVELKAMARDLEYAFINGSFVRPSDNNTARKTRGILSAIDTLPSDMSGYTTNAIAAAGAELSIEGVLNLMQDVWQNGGIQEEGTATLMCNAWQKRMLTAVFIRNKFYREQSRNVGGVDVDTIETDFGQINVMLNRFVPTDTVVLVSLEQCAPVFLNIPGKGFLFVEPLAKVGASERMQIYGEVGLEYGNPLAHGKITGLNTTTYPAHDS